jgi:hypothetical protein
MNAGDAFASAHALSDLFAGDHDDADLVYGDHVRCYPGRGVERIVQAEAAGVLPYRMPCSHQALAARRDLLRAHPFRTELLAADYEFLLDAYKGGRRFKRVDCLVARTETEGRSDKARLRSLRERVAILRDHGVLSVPLRVHYGGLALKVLLSAIVRKLLPRPVTNWILQRRPLRGLG